MLETNQAAERLGISRSMIYKLISGGLLEAYRIGSKLLISEEQIESFLESAKNKSIKKLPESRRHF